MNDPTFTRNPAFLRRSLSLILASGALVFAPDEAGAYCRATDCGVDDTCTIAEDGCVLEGLPLGWMLGSDATFAVDPEGIELSTVSLEDAESAMRTATLAWAGVMCEAGTPDVTIRSVETLEDAVVTVRFRTDEWPYEARAVAKTTLDYGLESGTISHALVELNALNYPFARSPEQSEIDLVAVLTHEFGHALGLDHSSIQGATMEAESTTGWVGELRTLDQDDVDGICSLYPPADENATEYDLSDDVELLGDEGQVGCSIGGSRSSLSPTSGANGLVALALIALATLSRRARGSRKAT